MHFPIAKCRQTGLLARAFQGSKTFQNQRRPILFHIRGLLSWNIVRLDFNNSTDRPGNPRFNVGGKTHPTGRCTFARRWTGENPFDRTGIALQTHLYDQSFAQSSCCVSLISRYPTANAMATQRGVEKEGRCYSMDLCSNYCNGTGPCLSEKLIFCELMESGWIGAKAWESCVPQNLSGTWHNTWQLHELGDAKQPSCGTNWTANWYFCSIYWMCGFPFSGFWPNDEWNILAAFLTRTCATDKTLWPLELPSSTRTSIRIDQEPPLRGILVWK